MNRTLKKILIFYLFFINFYLFSEDKVVVNKLKIKSTELLFKSLENRGVDFNKNLFVTLSVRNLDPNLQIIALARDENDATKLKLAGATATINPYETTAIKIFRLIHRPVALHILNDILYSDSDLIIKEVTVPHNSKLEDKMTKEIDILINIISF